jgi:membrane-associated protein
MLSSGLLTWIGNDQMMLKLLVQNWQLGILVIALVVFCETGLVVLPFLPGDSLLFATGTFLGLSGMSPWASVGLVTLAAIAGDSANYAIGRSVVGQQLIKRGWVKPTHLSQSKDYFDRFGGLTVTLGRFIPVVRTFAPFMAGLTGMEPRRFFAYNVLGAIVWCGGLMLMGVWFGKVPWVRGHMRLLSMSIVTISLLPVLMHVVPRFKKNRTVLK